MRRLTQTITF
uniref:Uncharacterized protein n=1 Tax=Lepeophtheirus salmonis TaxID=72036 RepID=A0A0K2TIT4_LEPSM